MDITYPLQLGGGSRSNQLCGQWYRCTGLEGPHLYLESRAKYSAHQSQLEKAGHS